MNGTGVEQDLMEAVKWFRKAAEQEDASAQLLLGVAYANGIGVETNRTEAVKWYRKAAEQGHGGAQKRIDEIQEAETRTSVCHDVKLRRPWLVPVTSCRAAMKNRYDSRAFILGMARGLVEGDVIFPSVDKCGYRVLSISDRCVWFEAFCDDEPPESNLPRGPWPDFSRIDTKLPVPPPGKLVFGKRSFWLGDAIKLPNAGFYLMVDDFLDGKAIVFRLLDSSFRPIRDLLCVIVREEK